MVGPSIDSSRPRSLLGLERGDNQLVVLDALRPHCLHQRGGRLGGCRHRCSQCSRSRRPQAPHKTQPWALARSLAARMKAINEMGISCAPPLILRSLVERLPISDYRVLPAHTGSRVQLGLKLGIEVGDTCLRQNRADEVLIQMRHDDWGGAPYARLAPRGARPRWLMHDRRALPRRIRLPPPFAGAPCPACARASAPPLLVFGSRFCPKRR